MQMLFVSLAVAATIAAPYALIMAFRSLLEALVAAVALAVPTGIALARVHAYGPDQQGLTSGFDAVLLTATLAAIALALFVRTLQAILGERARSRPAFVALNVLGLACGAMAMPLIIQFAGRLPTP